MAIVKWLVGSWGSAPERKEYEKETPYFYIYRSGSQKRLRRDAKKSGYLSYFDSEAEALEFIRQREERRRNNKRADNIRRHGVELLDMLEEARRTLEAWKDAAPAVSLCADIDKLIAKAKGEA